MDNHNYPEPEVLEKQRTERANIIKSAGGINQALVNGSLSNNVDITLSEALVIGLLKQNVTRFISVFGHGSTEVGEVLRIYAKAGLVKVYGVRSEIEASHAATALRWVTGEKAAVVTSIGPGALQAMAASLAPASLGVGVWYLLGDETSEDEGFNMQQIPKHEQNLFLKLFSTMGNAYSLHTPGSLPTALLRGLSSVDAAHSQSPFYLLMPMNTQAAILEGFNLNELPEGEPKSLAAANDDGDYKLAAEKIMQAEKVTIRAGGGARYSGAEIEQLSELSDGVVVTSPLVSGLIPYNHPRNMTVGGSKGSICGNYAMEEADLLIVVGSRSVCQSDSSRTAYPNVKQVITINSNVNDAIHYNNNISLVGDAKRTLKLLNNALQKMEVKHSGVTPSKWLKACAIEKEKWNAFKKKRYNNPVLYDDKRKMKILTQPAAIKIASDWAKDNKAVSFFDAGDVQANGFQIVEDAEIGQTFTDTGASYMGFAVSALLATGISDKSFYGIAFTGDGSFMMNPQILIDGVEHGARGCVLLFDNRRMAAITGLQMAQYGNEFATDDSVAVDYVAMAKAFSGVEAFYGGTSKEELESALNKAFAYKGLSLIHVPVYAGDDPLGGLGAWGRWNVGNWVTYTQKLRHKIGL